MEVDTTNRDCTSEANVRKYVPRRLLEASGEVSKEELFLRKLKGIFNKICPKSSDEQVVEIVDTLKEISTSDLSPQVWHSIAKCILQRAIVEPNYHPIYIGLCTKISQQYSGLLVPDAEDGTEGFKFGDLFLPAFEAEIQQRISVEDADAELLERMREKLLNATKFVGEIGKKSNMFSGTAGLLRPVTILLAFLDEPKFSGTFSGIQSMSVECACTLLNLIGKGVDMNPNETTNKIFQTVQELGENKSISPRLRFMAKGLSELRGNRWLPRVLTKQAAESSPSPSPSPAASTPSAPPQMVLPSGGACRERDEDTREMSMEDAELFSAMENFVQKLNGKTESCAANVLRKFVKSINTDQAKILATVFAENPELAALAPPLPSPRASDKLFIRRSASQVLSKGSNSPQPLSRNFHAIINLIKLNNSSTISEEVTQSLVSKVETLRASELIEVVGSIFRKMCEMPEEYPYCLNICLTLASNTRTTPHSFQETLETCCQDETALKMFNTQASLNTYLQLVNDLENKLHIDTNVVKRCVGNVQNGLYELNEQEASILAALESKVSPASSTTTTPTSTPSPAPFTSSKLTPTTVDIPPDPFATYTPQKDEEASIVEESKAGSEEQVRPSLNKSRGSDADWSRRC